jgi:hypothetical protein
LEHVELPKFSVAMADTKGEALLSGAATAPTGFFGKLFAPPASAEGVATFKAEGFFPWVRGSIKGKADAGAERTNRCRPPAEKHFKPSRLPSW